MFALPRAARLTAWGNAVLSGVSSPDEAAARVVAGDDLHRVVGLDTAVTTVLASGAGVAAGALGNAGEQTLPAAPASGVPAAGDEQTLPVALARLARLGARFLRLSLPAPGDPLGLPGPAAFNAAAVEAGEAVVTDGGPPLGLVPAVVTAGEGSVHVTVVRWRAYPVQRLPSDLVLSLAAAEHELHETLRVVTRDLVALDVARWRPEVAGALKALRAPADGDGLGPAYPPRAARVLALACRVAAIAELAGSDPGGAVSAGEMAARERALRPLDRAARRAQVAALDAVRERRGV